MVLFGGCADLVVTIFQTVFELLKLLLNELNECNPVIQCREFVLNKNECVTNLMEVSI